MLSWIDFDFFSACRREFPHYNAFFLLIRHIKARSLNISTTNHICDQLSLRHRSSPDGFCESIEDIAHRRLGMRYYHWQFIAFRQRQIDRQRKRVLDRELLLKLVSIGRSYRQAPSPTAPNG